MADAKQTQVVNAAKKYIGSKDWNFFAKKGNVLWGECKCNIFVAQVLGEAGLKVPCTNKAGKYVSIVLNLIGDSTERPLCCADWYNTDNGTKWEAVKLVGKGVDGLNKSWPGDIVTDGKHIGIISGPKKTISATLHDGVVENDWGWRSEQLSSMKVFRYHP